MSQIPPTIRTCPNPVFIVGAPRTSSSFWLTALVKAADLRGLSEGHLLPLLSHLDHKVVGYYALLDQMGMLSIQQNVVARVPESSIRENLLNIFANYYSMLFGNHRWVDKTVNAEMIMALPYLLSAWPEAKIIYLKRSAITNVQSAMNYFKVDFEEACRNWTRCGELWSGVRPKLPKDCFIEIEHNELLAAPEKTAHRVSDLLALSNEAQYRLAEYVKDAAEAWQQRRGDRDDNVIENWTHEQKNLFYRLCGHQLVAQGYLKEIERQLLLKEFYDANVIAIRPADVKILRVDRPDFCHVKTDSIHVIPGRQTAALLYFEALPSVGMKRLEAHLEITHPESQGVRFEFTGTCANTGAIIIHGRFELIAMEKRTVSADFTDASDKINLLIRVTNGAQAHTNDYSHCRISDLQLTA